MADGENPRERDHEPADQEMPRPPQLEPRSGFRMELVDSLPGGRAVIGVEQAGSFAWLASREHVSKQAVEEFTEQIGRIVREGWWVQNWPGA